jgi:hypothetical protein
VSLTGAALLCAVLLSGCASTLTVAWGDGARAALAFPYDSRGPNCESREKRTETTIRDGKLGPDDVTTVTVTEPSPATPAHESRGAKVSQGGASLFFSGLRLLGCAVTLGALCGP